MGIALNNFIYFFAFTYIEISFIQNEKYICIDQLKIFIRIIIRIIILIMTYQFFYFFTSVSDASRRLAIEINHQIKRLMKKKKSYNQNIFKKYKNIKKYQLLGQELRCKSQSA